VRKRSRSLASCVSSDSKAIPELLGHKDIRMTMRYAHLSPNHRKATVEKIVPTRSQKAKRSGLRIVPGETATGD
jgi:integrase